MTAIDISREACERLANVGFGYDLTKDDRAMILALRAALDAERWRSIATEPPPMDGREVLLYGEGFGMAGWPPDAVVVWEGITHWRPLPEPPEVM